jgi:hypothetical protein
MQKMTGFDNEITNIVLWKPHYKQALALKSPAFELLFGGAASWGKPDHVRLMELAWGIREDRPGEVRELPHLESATANPIVLTFEEEERGLRVFFAARWLNNTAQSGPWSDIESAVIP